MHKMGSKAKHNLKTCSFCNRELTKKTKSKEHVWPKWLHKKLDMEKKPFQGVHTDMSGLIVKSTRSQSMNSLVLGGVCTECNNGWMSDLEMEVAPLFDALWFLPANDKNITLKKEACKSIAFWAFKTSLVINLVSNYRRIVLQEHYNLFYEQRKLPENVVVDISLTPFKNDVFWHQGQFAKGVIPGEIEVTEAMAKIISTLYVITLDLGGIMLRTSWVPTNFLEVKASNNRNIRRIWPLKKEIKLSLAKREYKVLDFHTSVEFKVRNNHSLLLTLQENL